MSTTDETTTADRIDAMMTAVSNDTPPARTFAQDAGRQPAFDGLTVRDWLAGQALAGLLSAHSGDVRLPSDREAAEDAYAYADAMLKKRLKTPA